MAEQGWTIYKTFPAQNYLPPYPLGAAQADIVVEQIKGRFEEEPVK